MTTLLFADVAGIQEWIVGNATELQMVRGGSQLLDRAFAETVDGVSAALGPAQDDEGPLTGWRVVARSSGRLSMEVASAEDAERAAEVVRAGLAARLEGLQVTVGIAPIDGSLADARREARRNATTTGTRRPPTFALGTDTCEVTGTATASAQPTRNEGWRLSPGAAERRRHAEADLDDELAAATRDLREIGRATLSSRYSGYVAVVSADGNAVGQRFLGIESIDEMRATSSEVHEAVLAAVDAAQQAAADADLEARGESRRVPINQVVAAGDDLRFVVPAHVAVPFAVGLTTGAADMQACAGVLLCHDSLPFSLAHDTAEALLAVAKREARAADPDHPSAHVALARAAGSSPDAEPWDALHASPYRAAEMEALWDAAGSLDTSTSSVRNVVRALRAGGRAAEREWRLFLHAQDDATLQDLARLWQVLGSDDLAATPFPSTRSSRNSQQVSPLADLIVLRRLRQRTHETAEVAA